MILFYSFKWYLQYFSISYRLLQFVYGIC